MPGGRTTEVLPLLSRPRHRKQPEPAAAGGGGGGGACLPFVEQAAPVTRWKAPRRAARFCGQVRAGESSALGVQSRVGAPARRALQVVWAAGAWQQADGRGCPQRDDRCYAETSLTAGRLTSPTSPVGSVAWARTSGQGSALDCMARDRTGAMLQPGPCRRRVEPPRQNGARPDRCRDPKGAAGRGVVRGRVQGETPPLLCSFHAEAGSPHQGPLLRARMISLLNVPRAFTK